MEHGGKGLSSGIPILIMLGFSDQCYNEKLINEGARVWVEVGVGSDGVKVSDGSKSDKG